MAVICAVMGGLALAFSQMLIFFYAPVEASLGIIQKIFYMHVALAWWALISFFMVFLGSIHYLYSRKLQTDSFCTAAAEVGLLFASLVLLTGIIWAKKSWGVWWTWDPRLTTSLIMCFIYGGYLIFRNIDLPPARRRMIAAAIGIVAFLDVPLVFFSARIFRSIHPAVFASREGGLDSEMKLAAIACVISMGFIWLALLLCRKRQIDLNERIHALLFNRELQDTEE